MSWEMRGATDAEIRQQRGHRTYRKFLGSGNFPTHARWHLENKVEPRNAEGGQVSSRAKAWRYLYRALLLRCPECGACPVFIKLRRVRSLAEWLTPLEGCSRCQYRYEREPGYFAPAIWYIHYFLASAVGLAGGLIAEGLFHATFFVEILWAIIPALIVAVVAIRWSKSIFLSIDHLIDPVKKDGA
jgi:uncharacterized protein (DUF983 family)